MDLGPYIKHYKDNAITSGSASLAFMRHFEDVHTRRPTMREKAQRGEPDYYPDTRGRIEQ